VVTSGRRAGVLLSVSVGMPRDVTWHGRTVHTAVWKKPVAGPRMVRRLNIDGDGQGDLAGHGGEQRAVFVYQIESHRYWQDQLGRDDFSYGQFGENFTVQGVADDQVCIGDQYQIGGAVFEVTQPRVTCFRVGIRMDDPQMPALLVSHHRPGFYFRVLTEGAVSITATGSGAARRSTTCGMTCVPPRARSARTGIRARQGSAKPGTQATTRTFTAGTGGPPSRCRHRIHDRVTIAEGAKAVTTPVCEMLGIEQPIVQAPMAAIPGLAAAVSNAGALGMVTLTWSEDAGAVVRETAALTARPFGGNLVLTEGHHRRLEAALEAGLRIVSFMWGDPSGYIEPVGSISGERRGSQPFLARRAA
jgi:MOSC domain-containing protein YiiM